MSGQDQSQVINTLKVRLFDAEEALRGESQFKEQFFGQLSKILGLEGDEATDPNNYLLSVQHLKDISEKAQTAAEPVEIEA